MSEKIADVSSESIADAQAGNTAYTPPENLIQPPKKKKRFISLELFIIIMLGITAVLTALASWLGSVHTGNQNENYAVSNIFSTAGNTSQNRGSQALMMDQLFHSNVNDLFIELHFAERAGDELEMERLRWTIHEKMYDSISFRLHEAIGWAWDEADVRGDYVSPFENEDFVASYYEESLELMDKSLEYFARGQQDGVHSNAIGLTTVIYAMVLFLLGIANSFKTKNYRVVIVMIACAAFLFATIYMLTIPLPEASAVQVIENIENN